MQLLNSQESRENEAFSPLSSREQEHEIVQTVWGPLIEGVGLVLTAAQDVLGTAILRGSSRATDGTDLCYHAAQPFPEDALFSTPLILLGHGGLGLKAQTCGSLYVKPSLLAFVRVVGGL